MLGPGAAKGGGKAKGRGKIGEKAPGVGLLAFLSCTSPCEAQISSQERSATNGW